MPTYNKENDAVIFAKSESSDNSCPVCGGSSDYGNLQVLISGAKYPWRCPDCGATGGEYVEFVFVEHRVDVDTIPGDKLTEYMKI